MNTDRAGLFPKTGRAMLEMRANTARAFLGATLGGLILASVAGAYSAVVPESWYTPGGTLYLGVVLVWVYVAAICGSRQFVLSKLTQAVIADVEDLRRKRSARGNGEAP